MKSLWLSLFFEAVLRLIGVDRWEVIKTQVLAAEFLSGFDGMEKKKYVIDRVEWLVLDLKKGTSSKALQQIAHIVIAIAVDAICAKLKIENRL